MINEQAVPLLRRLDEQARAVVELDAVAGGELHAAQRRGFQRVLAVSVRRGKENFDAPELRAQHDAEPEFGLAVTDPSLACTWRIHHDRSAAATARMQRFSKISEGWSDAHTRTFRACGIAELLAGTITRSSGV